MTLMDSLSNYFKLSTEKDKNTLAESKMFDSNSDAFSKVLESANKSNNFSYEKVSETPLQYSNSYSSSLSFSETFNNETSNFASSYKQEPVEKSYENKETSNSNTTQETEFLKEKPVERVSENSYKNENNNQTEENVNSNKKETTEESSSKNNETKKEVSEEKSTKSPQETNEELAQKTQVDNEKTKKTDKSAQNQVLVTVPIQVNQQKQEQAKSAKESKNKVSNSDKESNKGLKNAQNVLESNKGQDQAAATSQALKNVQKNAAEKSQNSEANSKETNNKVAQPLQNAQKTSEKAQTEGLKVAVKAEALKGNTAETQNIEKDLKMKADISQELKPVVTKLHVDTNASQNNHQQSNNKQGQENSANESKVGIKTANPQLTNIESHITKLNLDKASEFDKVLSQTKEKDTVNQAKVLNQVTEKTTEAVKENKTQINIALRPERLGRINVNIISDKSGLSAQITAETKEAKDVLTKGLETLKQNLQEQGVNVNNINIKVQEPAPQQNNQNMEQELANKFQQGMENKADSDSSANNQANNAGKGSVSQGETIEGEMGTKESSEETAPSHNGVVDYRV